MFLYDYIKKFKERLCDHTISKLVLVLAVGTKTTKHWFFLES